MIGAQRVARPRTGTPGATPPGSTSRAVLAAAAGAAATKAARREIRSTRRRPSRIVWAMGNIPVLVLVGALAFAWTMWAVLFWGSIALIERHNPFNTFRAALGWSGINLAISATLGGIIGVGVLLVWVVFLLRLLLGRYELGALHAVGVV